MTDQDQILYDMFKHDIDQFLELMAPLYSFTKFVTMWSFGITKIEVVFAEFECQTLDEPMVYLLELGHVPDAVVPAFEVGNRFWHPGAIYFRGQNHIDADSLEERLVCKTNYESLKPLIQSEGFEPHPDS